jgi:hypothetical protein
MKLLEKIIVTGVKYNRMLENYNRLPESHKPELKQKLDKLITDLDRDIKEYFAHVKTNLEPVFVSIPDPVPEQKQPPKTAEEIKKTGPKNPVIADPKISKALESKPEPKQEDIFS